jgi:hypothetical protein
MLTTSVGATLERSLQLYPDHSALDFGARLLTYGDVDHWSRACAQLFLELGLGPGSRVPVPAASGPWFEVGHGGPGVDIPVNTNGGAFYTHIGNYGMFALLQSVRQLRGEAAAQVPDVKFSVAHGPAGFFAAAGTAVLGGHP